jgi:periplasmic protein TonB
MFEFAISRNQRRRPTGRIILSWISSCITHLVLLVLLIENPQLLRGGMYHRFRPLSLVSSIFAAQPKDENKNYRTVTILEPMTMPSEATLRKNLYDWNKKKEGKGAPPIRIRWGDEQKAALNNNPPMPKVQQEPKPAAPPVQLPPPNDLASGSVQPPPIGRSAEGGSGSSVLVPNNSAGAKKEPINLPPPGPTPKSEVTADTAPTSIPNGTKSPADTPKVFENEQKAIREPGTGFFDTKGFPLGDYASQIIERIKGKWFIPSNLRNSQGRTTIVFFIDKEGRFANARIVMGSGNNSLDLAALNAVIEANPFPPLPKGFPGNHVGAKFVFSYNERQ